MSNPRVVQMKKTETGFGFNVRGQVSEGGVLRSINGQLYAPLQHVSAVLPGGVAENAGILKGDRILEVNGVNVEGATHKQVVDLIKHGGDKLTITVISVTASEALKLEPLDDQYAYSTPDYSEKRSLPISIPDYHIIPNDEHTKKMINYLESSVQNGNSNQKYVVFNIYMAGRHLCSRRYSEFVKLNNNLKRIFEGFNFPKLPGKWPFQLSDQQLDARRRGLELYLEKVCAVRVIAESEIMQEFLTDHEDESSTSVVDLKVLLPDRNTVTLTMRKNSTANELYHALIMKINMDKEVAKYFTLFEIMEYSFDRKLRENELVHNLYIQNYSTANSTCLALKKWLFSIQNEIDLCRDELAETYVFYQAIEDVNHGLVNPGKRLYELKALQDCSKRKEYLKMVRELPGYGELIFPHCLCDARKNGHVIGILSFNQIKLQACTEDGMIEDQIIEFKWNEIENWEINEEQMCFQFVFKRPPKKSRLVKVFTPYFVFMFDSFERIYEERRNQEKLESMNKH